MTINAFNNSLFVNHHNIPEAAPLVQKRTAMSRSKSRSPYNGARAASFMRAQKRVGTLATSEAVRLPSVFCNSTERQPKSHYPVTTIDVAEHITVPNANCLSPTETQFSINKIRQYTETSNIP
jgi:hypothetical protein